MPLPAPHSSSYPSQRRASRSPTPHPNQTGLAPHLCQRRAGSPGMRRVLLQPPRTASCLQTRRVFPASSHPGGSSAKPSRESLSASQELSENSQGAASESHRGPSCQPEQPKRDSNLGVSPGPQPTGVMGAITRGALSTQAPHPAQAPRVWSILGPARSRPRGRWAPPRCRTTWVGRVGIGVVIAPAWAPDPWPDPAPVLPPLRT